MTLGFFLWVLAIKTMGYRGNGIYYGLLPIYSMVYYFENWMIGFGQMLVNMSAPWSRCIMGFNQKEWRYDKMMVEMFHLIAHLLYVAVIFAYMTGLFCAGICW